MARIEFLTGVASVNDSIARAARKNHTLILQALAKVSQEKVAELVGISGSTLSVFKGEQMERMSAVLAACGLKVVLSTDESIGADKIWALRILARDALDVDMKPNESGFGGLS